MSRMPSPARRIATVRRTQRGVVLFIALIVLVAMSFAGVALMRSVGTGTQVAGNIAFKQATLAASDWGLERGREWLMLGQNTNVDAASQGYFSSWGSFDPTKHTWTDSNSINLGADPAGNQVRYVIHRMCLVAGMSFDDVGQSCATLMSTSNSTSKTQDESNSRHLTGAAGTYFRITVRVVGPKNTVTYAQMTTF